MPDGDELVGVTRIDRWGYLFALLVITIVVVIALPTSPVSLVLTVALVCLALLLALRTSRIRKRAMRIGYAGAAAAFALAVGVSVTARYVTGVNTGGLIYAILATLLLVAPPAILMRILTYDRVTGQSLLAALSAYLMIGLFFAFFYLSVNAWSSQPFFAQGPNSNPAVYVYMSYITMTTTGYGDFTPATDLGRAIAVLESLVGQIFLVTTVARLVSMWSGPALSGGRSEADEGARPLAQLRHVAQQASVPENESAAPGALGTDAADEPSGA